MNNRISPSVELVHGWSRFLARNHYKYVLAIAGLILHITLLFAAMSQELDSVIHETNKQVVQARRFELPRLSTLRKNAWHIIWHCNILQQQVPGGHGLRHGKGGCRERCRELRTHRHHLVESVFEIMSRVWIVLVICSTLKSTFVLKYVRHYGMCSLECMRLKWESPPTSAVHIPFIILNECVWNNESSLNRARNMFEAQMRIRIQARSPLCHVFARILKFHSCHATTCATERNEVVVRGHCRGTATRPLATL